MNKIFISFFLFITFLFPLQAQLVSTTFDANWVYIPQNPVNFIKPYLFKAGFENWFTNRIALGVNLQAGIASIEDEDYSTVNGRIISEKTLEVSNAIYSLNIYNKIAIFNGDDYNISLKPEVGIYWAESMPSISFIDHLTGNVDVKQYSRINRKSLSFGLGIQGQYFIKERWDLCLNIGYNNYDFGKSLNRIELNDEWPHKFNEKTFFLSAGLGFHYYLFGMVKRQ